MENILTNEEVDQIVLNLLKLGQESIEEDIQNNSLENRIMQLAQAVAAIPNNKNISIQQAYQRAFALIDYVDYFLGKLPRQIAYVTNTGSVYTASLIHMANYINNNYRIAGGSRGMKKMLISEMNEKFSKRHVEKVKAAFQGTKNRLNRFYEKYQTFFSQRQGGLLLYKQSSKWLGQRVLNFGDVKEAYFSAMVDSDQTIDEKPVGSNKFKSHELISYFAQKYLYFVSNKSAISEEDVSSDILSAQFAVKGSKASAPKLQQYINLATEIINKKKNASLKEVLENYFALESQDEKKGLRNLVVESGYKTKIELENAIEKMLVKQKNLT